MRGDARPTGEAPTRLTPSEIRVLAAIADGKTARQIAADFGRSQLTIRDQTKKIRQKLNAHTCAEAVAIGFRDGTLD